MPRRSTAPPLTSAGLALFLHILDSNNALSEERYRSLRQKLQRYFEWHGCHDPLKAIDETIDRTIRKLTKNYDRAAMQALLYGIAKNVLRESQRKHPPEVPLTIEHANQITIDTRREDRRVGCLTQCLKGIAATNRRLFISYYDQDQATSARRQNLADAAGLNLNTLRQRVFQTSERLRQCVTKCMVEQPASRPETVH